VPAAAPAATAAAAAATKDGTVRRVIPLLLVAALASPSVADAGVLPEDRADALYHRYDGGGVTIDGPSLLVRKKFAEKYSVSANYYMDMVSSASIDVMTTASPYTETRTQMSAALDALNGKTQYSVNFTNSDENDYTANSASLDISQDMFGDLTNVSFGFSRGWDEVRKRGDTDFSEAIDRSTYRVGVSQILTPKLMMGLNYELVSDEGFLNNPYRSVRYIDPGSASGFAFQPEIYPRTRTSNAASLNARYYLPYRAAVHGEYRFFTDTWGIDANTVQVGYTHPWGKQWIFELTYRWYDQSAADFYSDLFPRQDAQNFLARDKELSTFTSHMIGLGATYELPSFGWSFMQRSTVSLFYDRFRFDYDDFRDITAGGAPGTEPLYGFDADVIRLFFSGWF
jgi:hypothetical protein